MKISVKTLDNGAAGELELSDALFGLPVRSDILHRVVNWQLAKRRAGTHKTKTVSEISGTGKKPFKQKGTGNARQGSLRSAQMRGGATAFGPVVRSHAYGLPKKVRALGLKTALSAKQAEGTLIVLEDFTAKEAKASVLQAKFTALGLTKPLFIGGAEIDQNFVLAARNLKHVDVLPAQGVNVYDILNHRELVLSKSAIEALEARFK